MIVPPTLICPQPGPEATLLIRGGGIGNPIGAPAEAFPNGHGNGMTGIAGSVGMPIGAPKNPWTNPGPSDDNNVGPIRGGRMIGGGRSGSMYPPGAR